MPFCTALLVASGPIFALQSPLSCQLQLKSNSHKPWRVLRRHQQAPGPTLSPEADTTSQAPNAAPCAATARQTPPSTPPPGKQKPADPPVRALKRAAQPAVGPRNRQRGRGPAGLDYFRPRPCGVWIPSTDLGPSTHLKTVWWLWWGRRDVAVAIYGGSIPPHAVLEAQLPRR